MNRQRQPATQPRGDGTRAWPDEAWPDEAGNDFESAGPSRLQRAWAIIRWIALVVGCGLGAALAFAMFIAIVITLLGSSV